ncbi:MAG TPA: PQQ-dependent sugar dehydrogenase [Gemmatimonadaceae bacterium]|jgi:glucose/arabinose dehydrogenase
MPASVRNTRAAVVAVLGLAALAACSRKPNNHDSSTAAPVANSNSAAAAAAAAHCAGDNGGLTLPAGFCATVFADNLGHTRHIAVAPNGDVYVNSWPVYGGVGGSAIAGGFLIALRDTNRDGRAEIVQRWGPGAGRVRGGTGIGVHAGYVYAEAGTEIVRYQIPPGGLAPTAAAQVIVSDLPTGGDHPMHPFAIDSGGHMFVDMGSATNSCQARNRTTGTPGQRPCTELLTRGGVWLYDANVTGQRFSPEQRFATGIRNAVGIAIGPDGQPYSTQHGRDQLAENWPKLYTSAEGQNLPAEELLALKRGADYGWPYCYFDGSKGELVLAPEYGGNGTTVGDCASKTAPIAWFPAHWAPDGLVFYTGTSFPAEYRGGAFIAFHGSWNRAPGPQGGYNVVFQPFANGKPSGQYRVFADGFAGPAKEPGRAEHRPAGVAVGPDGALYVTDDVAGRIWRITWAGR